VCLVQVASTSFTVKHKAEEEKEAGWKRKRIEQEEKEGEEVRKIKDFEEENTFF